jgi:hypothetical protein
MIWSKFKILKLNSYNQHLNRYKQSLRESNFGDCKKVKIYETIYMHMANCNPVSLLNQQMIDFDEDDDYSKCKIFIYFWLLKLIIFFFFKQLTVNTVIIKICSII